MPARKLRSSIPLDLLLHAHRRRSRGCAHAVTPSYIFQPPTVAVRYGAARRGIRVDHGPVLGIDLALNVDFRAAGRASTETCLPTGGGGVLLKVGLVAGSDAGREVVGTGQRLLADFFPSNLSRSRRVPRCWFGALSRCIRPTPRQRSWDNATCPLLVVTGSINTPV